MLRKHLMALAASKHRAAHGRPAPDRETLSRHRLDALTGGLASASLGLGRRRRFHTGSPRIALAVRDQGCTALGCDAPPGLCHAHHDHPWSKGGHTDTTTGRLLRPRHHTLTHDQTYATNPTAHGKLRFIRRS